LVNSGHSTYIVYVRFNNFLPTYFPRGCENPFLIQGTVIRSANFVRLALGSINAGTPLTDRLTPGTVGIDLLPGRLSLALRRWIMGVPCFGVEPSTT